jgi:vancomycin permeability regulator SanA
LPANLERDPDRHILHETLIKRMAGIKFNWRMAKAAVTTLLGMFALAVAAIIFDGLSDRIFNADLLIVPGNTVTSKGEPSARLKGRLDMALELYRQGRGRVIFVSGGVGKEGIDEATVMRDYLIGHGVPRQAIVRDGQGRNTAETAIHASEYMKSRRLQSAIVVTQYFHISRTKLALRQAGIKKIGSAHAKFWEGRDLYSVPREAIAYIFYFASAPA